MTRRQSLFWSRHCLPLAIPAKLYHWHQRQCRSRMFSKCWFIRGCAGVLTWKQNQHQWQIANSISADIHGWYHTFIRTGNNGRHECDVALTDSMPPSIRALRRINLLRCHHLRFSQWWAKYPIIEQSKFWLSERDCRLILLGIVYCLCTYWISQTERGWFAQEDRMENCFLVSITRREEKQNRMRSEYSVPSLPCWYFNLEHRIKVSAMKICKDERDAHSLCV